jgi:hypothetical protein
MDLENGREMTARRYAWALGLFVSLMARTALAQPPASTPASTPADPGGIIEGLAAFADTLAPGDTWPLVRFPPPRPRPAEGGLTLCATLSPVCVHADPGVSDARARAALAALEDAALELDRMGWSAPPFDGGRGGTSGFDLYLRADDAFVDVAEGGRTPAPLERPAPNRFERASVDVSTFATHIDGAVTFAEMADGVDPALVPACALTAYADAMLLALDPAEAPAWRRATAVYLAYLVTGRFGCDESLVITQQVESFRSFASHDPSSGEGGALLVGAISARHDRETGAFIRDLWNADQQNSRDAFTTNGGDLHALPDFYYVLAHAVALARDPLTHIIEDFGASRYRAGARSSEGSAYPILRALPPAATVPTYATTRWDALPRSLRYDGALESYGSAYVTVDVSNAPPGSRLRVWLRGEFGVEWSMIALRLDAHGAEVARVRAPPRPTPEAYLPVELLDGTAQVVVVVTNLSARGLDADEPDDFARSFRVAMDRGE